MNKQLPIISVIIPVYNAETYFPDVFDKISKQTLSKIEIIIVDDQSTDNTYDLIKKYAAADSRIKILRNESKGGAGASRNKGLLAATGQYVIFLDDDDFVENTMLEKMYKTALKQKADVVVCHARFINWYSKEFANNSTNIRKDLLPSTRCFAGKDIEHDFFNTFIWWAWDKLYRREFVIKSKVKFQEIRTSNDLVFTTSLMLLASRITIQPEVLIYHTVARRTSLSNLRGLSWECALTALKGLQQFLTDNSLYPSRKQDFNNYVLSFLKWHLDTLSGDAYYKLFDSAKAFIKTCNIHASDIYRPEIVSFYEDIMTLPAHYYIVKKQNKEEISAIRDKVEQLLSQEQDGWGNDRFHTLNTKIDNLISQEQEGWGNDRFHTLNTKIDNLISQEQEGWGNDRFHTLNTKIDNLISQEQEGWGNDRFHTLNTKIDNLISQEQGGWGNDRFHTLNTKIDNLISQEQEGWGNDRFHTLNTKIDNLISQEQEGWGNDRFHTLNTKIDNLISQEQGGWANDRFNVLNGKIDHLLFQTQDMWVHERLHVLDDKLNQLIESQQKKDGKRNFFSRLKNKLFGNTP